MIFKVDFNRLVSLLLPVLLRQYKTTLLLRSAVFPIIQLYDKFRIARADNIYKIQHNGQVCYLRAALNDAFDTAARRIRIEDVVRRDWLMIYEENEEKPVLLGDARVWQEQYIGSDAADFVILIPAALNLDNNQMQRLIAIANYYKLVSKRYIIQVI